MTQTSSNSPGREPTDAVLLTVLESALMRLLERGLGAAAEESIRRVMAASRHTSQRQTPTSPLVAGPGASSRRLASGETRAPEGPSKNIIPFPTRSTMPCVND